VRSCVRVSRVCRSSGAPLAGPWVCVCVCVFQRPWAVLAGGGDGNRFWLWSAAERMRGAFLDPRADGFSWFAGGGRLVKDRPPLGNIGRTLFVRDKSAAALASFSALHFFFLVGVRLLFLLPRSPLSSSSLSRPPWLWPPPPFPSWPWSRPWCRPPVYSSPFRLWPHD